jgi:hypothetical protein
VVLLVTALVSLATLVASSLLAACNTISEVTKKENKTRNKQQFERNEKTKYYTL